MTRERDVHAFSGMPFRFVRVCRSRYRTEGMHTLRIHQDLHSSFDFPSFSFKHFVQGSAAKVCILVYINSLYNIFI